MKKFIILLLCALAVSGCSIFPKSTDVASDTNVNSAEVISAEEQEFLDSGRAKAIESTDDLMPPSTLSKLQGLWQSVEDPNSYVRFDNSTRYDLYQTLEVSTEKIAIYDEYPLKEGSLRSENGKYMISQNVDGNFDYEIVILTEEKLEIIYLPRGNTLKYTKVK